MNVVDFQLNKTIPRNHTHEQIKNKSKSKLTRAPAKRGARGRNPVLSCLSCNFCCKCQRDERVEKKKTRHNRQKV